jgi:predicted ATPase
MLRALEIKNFTVFEEAKLEFSPGLNVVIGENGTGKSHLLKLGYSTMQIGLEERIESIKSDDIGTYRHFSSVFKSESLINLLSHEAKKEEFEINLFYTKKPTASMPDIILKTQFHHKKLTKNTVTTLPLNFRVVHPIFIPTKEIFSIYNGFAAALRNRELDFDSTYLDLADALALTPLKGERAAQVKPLIETLEKQMDGKVVVENGRFYISTDSQKLEMPLVAEGIRKIAMLAYLLMNGSLQKGTTLFWDEPETNLNPKMIRHLAETLVVLSSMGIQIVLATHSLFLLRELQIQLSLNPNVPAQFFALKREGKSVTVQQGNSIEDVDPIAALDADLEQSDRYLELT